MAQNDLTERMDPSERSTLSIFLSYSRKDATFTQRLADALNARGYGVDFDQAAYDPDNVASGIAAEDEWWQRLQHMIVAADTMVFIVGSLYAAAALRLLFLTGTRLNEVLTLKWSYVDLQRRILILPDSKTGEPISMN